MKTLSIIVNKSLELTKLVHQYKNTIKIEKKHQ